MSAAVVASPSLASHPDPPSSSSTSREVLMDILSRHLDNTSQDSLHRSRHSVAASRSVRMKSSNLKDKKAHVRIESSSASSNQRPPPPPPKSTSSAPKPQDQTNDFEQDFPMTSPSQWNRGASIRDTPLSPAAPNILNTTNYSPSPALPNTSKSRKENKKEPPNQKRTRDKKEKHSDDRPSSKDQYNNKTFDAKKTNYETVLLNIPSCIVGLPQCWNSMHDRFIAYLATHAPLDENGMVPADEEVCERWSSEEMSRLLSERFEVLRGLYIKPSVIDMRLDLLDQAGDNDYFKMPYGAFAKQHWGKRI